MLTQQMAQALADAVECKLDPWAYGAGTIAALKRRGLIARIESSLLEFRGKYQATPAGRDAWVEWCRAAMVPTKNAAEA